MATKKSTKVKDTAEEVLKLFTEFFGGIQRDDKSTVPGGMSDVEELDILENANWVQPALVLSADTIPNNMIVGSYSEDAVGNGYAFGNLSGFASVMTRSNIGTASPGAWTTQNTSGTLVGNIQMGSAVHYEIESGNTALSLAYYFIVSNNHIGKFTASGGVVGQRIRSLLAYVDGISCFDARHQWNPLYRGGKLYLDHRSG